MASTYTRWVGRLLQGAPFRNGAGQRLMGAIGVLFDELAEGFTQAVRASWAGDSVGPAYDGLTAAGDELSLPRYPRESWAQYHARLQRAWDDWPAAGHETSILGQLAAAGFPGAVIYHANEWPLSGLHSWWSQFWVYFPPGTHTVTGEWPIVGSFVIGDGTPVGVTGLSLDDLFAMRRIARKFKPAHWICSGIVFHISGFVVGVGDDVGDSGLVIGGKVAVVGAT